MTEHNLAEIDSALPSQISVVDRIQPLPQPFPKKAFATNVVVFSGANVASLACNGVLTFLLPRLLSIESYGYYRLFILYGGFVGVLHLGLVDGALIRWAARPRQRMKAELLSSLIFLVAQHALLLIPIMAVTALFFGDQQWFFLTAAIGVYAAVYNVAALGQFALQADRLFGLLSLVTLLNPALLLVAVLVLNRLELLRLRSLLTAFIAAWLMVGIVVWSALLVKYPRTFRGFRRCKQIGVHNTRIGWSVLLASLVMAVAFSMDRIIVSVSYSIHDFAIYSLAANALAVVNTIILSVSRVVFPYLSDGLSLETRIRAYWWGEACLIAIWAASLAGYFPLHWLIERLLPNYIASLPVLRLLMLTTGMTAIVYILHTNYFRSSLRLRQMLLGCVVGLVAAGTFLAVARQTGRLPMMALATLAAICVWWLFNELLLQSLTRGNSRTLVRTILVYASCGLWFVFCASWKNHGVAFCAYLAVATLVVGLAYRSLLRTIPGTPRRLSIRFG
jgi:O-antigen/teichoic acid export membrane protein